MAEIQPTKISEKFLAALNRHEKCLAIYNVMMALYDEYRGVTEPWSSKTLIDETEFSDLYCELAVLHQYLVIPAESMTLNEFREFIVYVSIAKNANGNPLFNGEALESAIRRFHKNYHHQNFKVQIDVTQPDFADHKSTYGNDLEFLKFWIVKREYRDLTDHHDNKDLIRLAIHKTPSALRWASAALKRDKAFVAELCEIDPRALGYSSIALRRDEGFIYKLALADREVLDGVAPQLLKKYGLSIPGYENGYKDLWEALEINLSKNTLEGGIEPRIETEEAVQERKKRGRTL